MDRVELDHVQKGITPVLGAPVVPLVVSGCYVLPSAVMHYSSKRREVLPPPQPEGLVLLPAIFRVFGGEPLALWLAIPAENEESHPE